MENVKSVIYKKGFTLFEVILSLVIFSVLLISILRLDHNKGYLKTFYQLQSIENEYNESGIVNSSDTIQLQD